MACEELPKVLDEHKLGRDLKRVFLLTQEASNIAQGLPRTTPSQFAETAAKEILSPENLSFAKNEIHTLEGIVATLQRLEASAKKLEQAIADATQVYSYQLRHLQSHTSTSSWKSLPDDVWSEIFVMSKPESPIILPPLRRSKQSSTYDHWMDSSGNLETPWSFLEVCSRWRQIALNESRLWDNFMLRKSDKVPHAPYFSRHAQDVLKRNRTSSLSLIRVSDLHPTHLLHRPSVLENNAFISRFLKPFSNQLTSTSVSVFSRAIMEGITGSLPDPFLPLLQTIKIQITNDDTHDSLPLEVPVTFISKFLSSPHLRHIEIAGAFTDRIQLSNTPDPLPAPFPLNLQVDWKKVTTLIIRNIFTAPHIVYEIIAHHCPYLEEFKAAIWPPSLLNDLQESTTSPHLKKLTLSDAFSPILERVRADNLEELDLTCLDTHEPSMLPDQEIASVISNFASRSSRISNLSLNFACMTPYIGHILEQCRRLSHLQLDSMNLPVSTMNHFTIRKNWPSDLVCYLRLSDLDAFQKALQEYVASLFGVGDDSMREPLTLVVTVITASEEEEDAVWEYASLLTGIFEERGWYIEVSCQHP